MRKNALLIFIIICVLFCLSVVKAEDRKIECNVEVHGRVVKINGQTENIPEPKLITIKVGQDWPDLIYIDQTKCRDDGTFSFSFMIPDTCKYGTYP